MRYNYPNIVTLNLIIWCENIHMFIYLCYKGLCPIWSVCSRYLTQLMTNNRIRTVGCFNWIMSLEAWSPVTGSSLWASVAFCKSDQAESNSCTQTQLDYFIYVYISHLIQTEPAVNFWILSYCTKITDSVAISLEALTNDPAVDSKLFVCFLT